MAHLISLVGIFLTLWRVFRDVENEVLNDKGGLDKELVTDRVIRQIATVRINALLLPHAGGRVDIWHWLMMGRLRGGKLNVAKEVQFRNEVASVLLLLLF